MPATIQQSGKARRKGTIIKARGASETRSLMPADWVYLASFSNFNTWPEFQTT